MSKFIIECPVCHNHAQASKGFFASKHIRCACGNLIDVKTDKMATKMCPSCGNYVVFDQSKLKKAVCPVCHTNLINENSYNNLVHFRCSTCGCQLQAEKTAKTLTCPVCDTVADVQQALKMESLREAGAAAVISYEGDNNTFAWKHPMTDFPSGSQLIVHESQEAVFFRNGEALDSFGPGRYTLENGTMPRMEQANAFKSPKEPFHAEVYFVNLTTQMGIKWGTPSKIGLFDPATGLHVDLGACGSFNLRVTDARKLLIKLVGTTGGLSQADLFRSDSASAGVNTGYFRTMVSTKVKGNLARIIKENRINVLELDEKVDSISLALRDAINPDLEQYGLEMPEFYVSGIVTPDDDPNFRRMKQQHADMYLKTREEEIRKAEAEAIYERKSVEAQTAANVQRIDAEGEADALRIRAQAEADAYRMKAQAEAQEMQMKGYTYQQETQRRVATEAVRNGGSGMMGAMAGAVGEAIQMGIGLNTARNVIGMAQEAVQNAGNNAAQHSSAAGEDTWNCSCGQTGITSRFCPNCGAKKPEPWDCVCGQKGITSKFCPNCGARKADTWNCSCGQTNITSKFCPECGKKRE